MRREVERDLTDSARDFIDVVKPVIEQWTGGDVRVNENVMDSSVAEQLDQISGVDSWSVKTDDGIRAVASRVQWVDDLPADEPYDSFTIRKSRDSGSKTEYKKRLEAIHNDRLYPHWTVHAYLDRRGGELLSVGMVETKQLYLYIKNQGTVGEDYHLSRCSNAQFITVYWSKLRHHTTVGVRFKKPYEKQTVAASVDEQQKALDSF